MKILKKLGIGLLGFVSALLIIALFIPNDYTVSISTTINKPKSEVFDYVKLLKNQEKYSVWVMADPNLKPTYGGTDGTVGATQAWNSTLDEVGEGSQEITKITADSIYMNLHFIRPMESHEKAATIINSIDSTHTKVTADFYGHSPYPMNLMSFIGKNFITDAETKNLANLKAILEKN